MFKDSLIIFRKEMRRVFTDRRMLFFLVVLPTVMLPLMYWFMGKANRSRMTDIASYSPSIAVVSGAGSQRAFELVMTSLEEMNARISMIDAGELETVRGTVTEGDTDLIIIIPEGADATLEERAPVNVELYHNSTLDYSESALEQVTALMGILDGEIVTERITAAGLPPEILTAFTVNAALDPSEYDLAARGSLMGKLVGMLVPFFVIIYLFANSMKVGLDIVAGEKERGTLGILLVNQVSRLSIVLGKMLTVMVAAIVGAACSAVGLQIGSRFLIDMYGEGGSSLAEFALTPTHILQFSIVVIPLAILIASTVLVVSTWARNLKEGQGLITPVYIAVMILGMTTMQSGDVTPGWMRLAPLCNSLVVLKDIFMNNAVWGNILYASASSALLAAVIIFITFRMFNDERILFRV